MALIGVSSYNKNITEYRVDSVKELRELMNGKTVYVEVQGRNGVFQMNAKKAEVVAMYEWLCGGEQVEDGNLVYDTMRADTTIESVYIYFE